MDLIEFAVLTVISLITFIIIGTNAEEECLSEYSINIIIE